MGVPLSRRGWPLRPQDAIGTCRIPNKNKSVFYLIRPCREPERGWLKTIDVCKLYLHWARHGTDCFLGPQCGQGRFDSIVKEQCLDPDG